MTDPFINQTFSRFQNASWPDYCRNSLEQNGSACVFPELAAHIYTMACISNCFQQLDNYLTSLSRHLFHLSKLPDTEPALPNELVVHINEHCSKWAFVKDFEQLKPEAKYLLNAIQRLVAGLAEQRLESDGGVRGVAGGKESDVKGDPSNTDSQLGPEVLGILGPETRSTLEELDGTSLGKALDSPDNNKHTLYSRCCLELATKCRSLVRPVEEQIKALPVRHFASNSILSPHTALAVTIADSHLYRTQPR